MCAAGDTKAITPPAPMNTFGGYRVQGRGDDAERIRRDAGPVMEAGAFSVVLETVPEQLAQAITAQIAIPTIGIGAWLACDGPMVDDGMGMFTRFRPKFVKRHTEPGSEGEAAIAAYAADVRDRRFPAAEHVYATASRAGDLA